MKRRRILSAIQFWRNRHEKLLAFLEFPFWMTCLILAWEVYGPMFAYIAHRPDLEGKMFAAFLVVFVNFILKFDKIW